MKIFSIRLGIVAGVLVVMVASALALANPHTRKDTRTCKSKRAQIYCTGPTACEDSVYTIGVCTDDQTGAESAVTIECCCCTDGADQRSWTGG
jgi:hypothetical protein